MSILRIIIRPPLRTVILLLSMLGLLFLFYHMWNPGIVITDGRHDRRMNGMWIQHGWLGDDSWFTRYHKDPQRFRDLGHLSALAKQLSQHHIVYVYPHVCPSSPDGQIAVVDDTQTERLLDVMEGYAILPWVGGVLEEHCWPDVPQWRQRFLASIDALLHAHPRLAGIHINIEPMPSGNENFLTLLQEMRDRLPTNKILSVAAYPPPTLLHPFSDVHWDESYFKKVARHADQLVVMMYDTGIRWNKVYQSLLASWTRNVLVWAQHADVLLGVPVYDDAGVGYHHPTVENLENSLRGIHAGLKRFPTIPPNYRGIALYSEWEMDPAEWEYLFKHFNMSR